MKIKDYLTQKILRRDVGNLMHIERIQIEEGFLDGLDIDLTSGLNLLIGAR